MSKTKYMCEDCGAVMAELENGRFLLCESPRIVPWVEEDEEDEERTNENEPD